MAHKKPPSLRLGLLGEASGLAMQEPEIKNKTKQGSEEQLQASQMHMVSLLPPPPPTHTHRAGPA